MGNSSGTTVSVIDTATNMVVATVAVGNNALGVAVNPAGTRVYVANFNSNSISVIDTGINTVVDTIPVGNRPLAFGQFIGPVTTCEGAGPSSIKGKVKQGRRVIPAVTFTLQGPNGCLSTTATDTKGKYRFEDLADGTYTVTPAKAGCTFKPRSRKVMLEGEDAAANFKATCP